jgi:YlmC/YmxH family sporulation protein
MIFLKITTFSRLCEKQVANCRNGKIIGYPTDLKIDIETGRIISIFVSEPCRIPIFSKPAVYEILWDKIDKIGDDLIIVDDSCFVQEHEPPKKDRKSFFKG